MNQNIELPKLKCTRCGHVWIPRISREPKQCPRCRSPYWNKPKWKGLKAVGNETMKEIVTKFNRMGKRTSIDDKVTYKYLKLNWSNWQDAAEKLLRVAYKLESERKNRRKGFISPHYSDVYYMLIGLALENYSKGAIVQKLLIGGESLDKDKLDGVLRRHDIGTLFSDAGLKIRNKLYESYLDYLTECVEWRGRYRLPTSARRIDGSIKYFPPDPKESGKARIAMIEMKHTIPIDVIHEFVDMAKAHLENLRQKAKAKKL